MYTKFVLQIIGILIIIIDLNMTLYSFPIDCACLLYIMAMKRYLFCFVLDDCQPGSFSVSNSYPVQIHVHIVAKIDRLRKSRSIVSSVSIARDGLSSRLLCIVFLDGMIDRVWVSFIGSRAKPTLT